MCNIQNILNIVTNKWKANVQPPTQSNFFLSELDFNSQNVIEFETLFR